MADVTNNLSLHIIDESEYIEPDPINENFKKVDAAFADYVVEQGIKGEWWYRKWNSGRAECGVDSKNFGTQECTKAWGTSGWYISTTEINFGAYPFAFLSKPFATVVLNDTDYAGYLGFIAPSGKGSTTTTAPIYVMANPKSDTFTNCKFSIYVVGKWK